MDDLSLVLTAAALGGLWLAKDTTKTEPTEEIDDATIPTAQAILDLALSNLGHAAAYHAETITPRQRLDVLHEIRLISKAWMRARAEALLEQVAPNDDIAKGLGGAIKSAVGGFFKAARKFIKNMFVAGSLSVFGPGEPTLAEVEGVNANIESQYKYLDAFEEAVTGEKPPAREQPAAKPPKPMVAPQDAEPPPVKPPLATPVPTVTPAPEPSLPVPAAREVQPLDGTLVSRAEQYGAAVWSGTLNVLHETVIDSNQFDEEKRVHIGKDVPCKPCAKWHAAGWVPLGSGPSIGLTPCRNNCHCHFVYRHSSNPTVEYIAGGGSLHQALATGP